jgi:DNA-binding response OmpR family regulator
MEKKILAVDDDLYTLKLLNNVLEKNGYEVHTLSRAENVFMEVSSFKPDLILLDVMLSGLDGTIICSALKTFPETQHIPVIFVSGHYSAASSLLSDQQGAPDDFLMKPFSIDTLIGKIEHQLAA